MLGCWATKIKSDSNTSVATEAARATIPVRSDIKSGLSIRVNRVITGRTNQPVDLSIITEAKAREWLFVAVPIRVTRKISPPTVVGRKFPTNWPAKKYPNI